MPGIVVEIDVSEFNKKMAAAHQAINNVSNVLKVVPREALKTAAALNNTGKNFKNAADSSATFSKELNGASSAAKKAALNIKSLGARILALVGAYKALEGIKGYYQNIIDFNSSIESSTISIASVLGATNKIATAEGKNLEGVEKFNAAQKISAELMEQIQVLALESTATFEGLADGVSGIIAPATKAGIAIEKLPKFAVTAAQAMAAMKIPTQQMRTEIEALLSGNINKVQDILATNLGITGKMVKNWQKQGTLIEELEKRLRIFAEAGKASAQTWSGLVSNLNDAYDYLSAKTGKGIFEGMKQSFRELLNVLVNTKGKLGVGEDIQNIVKMVTELQDEIGNGLVSVTRDFIDDIKELNKPENIADIKRGFSEFKNTLTGTFDILKSVVSTMKDAISFSLKGWSDAPDIIKEMGLIGAIALGTKGRIALLAIGAAAEGLERLQALIYKLGMSSSSDVTSQTLKTAGYLDQPELYDTGPSLASTRKLKTQPPALARSHAAPALARSHGTEANPGREKYKTGNDIGGFGGGNEGQSKIENAQEKIKRLREEIDRLNGTSVQAVTSLEQKLREIEKTGKEAGLSAQGIADLRNQYQDAFKANTLKDFNKEILQLQGNTSALREIEIGDTVKEWGQKLTAAGLESDEVTAKTEELKAALEKQWNTKNLQVTADFYKQLAEYSGDYNLSLEYQNRLIEIQGQNWIQNGIAEKDVVEMMKLMRQEAARDPWSGMLRGMRKWSGEATNLGKQVETSLTSAFDNASDALADFVTTGKLNFADLANSIISDLARIAARQAIGGIVGGLASGLGNLFSGSYTDTAKNMVNYIPGVNFSAKGNVFSGGNISDYSNSIVSRPTLFSYGSQLQPFARGAGLMGEAGREAIMPLARTSGGNLGVYATFEQRQLQRDMDSLKASMNTVEAIILSHKAQREAAAAPAPEVKVNIINNSNAQVTQETRTDNYGNKTIDVMVGDAAARQLNRPGTTLNKSFYQQTGLQRRAIRR